ncbi:MAG TPA: bifunctional UDP-sugar hydrolase/5'-nucleotidase [Virgibacillus sp.]|nr:bifunctional UDP-sugar hydrolase/5'-nucleotidase [Virgibacillus sp.]
MKEKLHIYYTNDLHSDFTYWPQVAHYLKRVQREKDNCWIADIGDHVDRVHPIAEAFMGKANVDLMNDIGYDVVTLGNNEGITLSHHDLHHLYDDASFQVVCANLFSMENEAPAWLQSSYRVETPSGIKIGYVGLTAPFNAFYNLLDWYISPPFEALQRVIDEVGKSCDVIVLLSHLGINEDREIARHFPEIDAIIGGHTHHLLRVGEKINETIITAAGKHCTYIGEVILTWDHTQRKLVQKEAYTMNITHMEKDPYTLERLNDWDLKAGKELGNMIIHTHKPIEVDWFKETELMRYLTCTLQEWTGADCALLNAGILLDSFSEGDITYGDVHRVCPHPINPCTVTLSGNELMEVVRVAFTKELTELALNGFGFRGKIIGKFVFAGLSVETVVDDQGNEKVINVSMNGKPIDKGGTYHVATIDTFTFGRLIPAIAKATDKKYYLPEFMRDLLSKTLQENFRVSA